MKSEKNSETEKGIFKFFKRIFSCCGCKNILNDIDRDNRIDSNKRHNNNIIENGTLNRTENLNENASIENNPNHISQEEFVINSLKSLNIPIHPHIYSFGFICEFLLSEWSPILNLRIVSNSVLTPLNNNKIKKKPVKNAGCNH